MTTFDEWQTQLASALAQPVAQGFVWNGRVCALLPPRPGQPDLVQWCVHLCQAPKDGSAEPWLVLMAWQLGAAGRLPVVVGADRSSRALMLTQMLPWAEFEPQDALAVLTLVVLAANELEASMLEQSKAAPSGAGARSSLDLLMRRQGNQAGSSR
jgi:hypothetical protein